MNLLYQEMTINDYEEAVQLWRSCKGMGLSSADEMQQIASFLQRNLGFSFVVRDSGKLIGTVLCGHDGRRGYLYHMAVSFQYRKTGLARALMDRALESLKKAGIQKCHIFVYGDNREGLLFWEKTGWKLRDELIILSKDIF